MSRITGKVNYKEVLRGDSGFTFKPHVTTDGILYWSNNGDLPNPLPVNIKGKSGDMAQEEEINKINSNITDICYNIKNYSNFNKYNLPKIIKEIVPNLKSGDTLLIPKGEYIINTTIKLDNIKNGVNILFEGDIIEDENFNGENLIEVFGGYFNIKINKIKGSTKTKNGLYIGNGHCYQGNFSINTIENCKNGIILNPKKTTTFNGIQYCKFNFNIISNCTNCILFDVKKDDGWVNENTFTGGSLNGEYGVLLINGNDNTATGYNNNKFYNVGFENINQIPVLLNNSNGNSFINCRMLESIHGNYYISEEYNCNWNLFIFSSLLPLEKLNINGHLSNIIAPISINDSWVCNGFTVKRGVKYFDVENRFFTKFNDELEEIPYNTGYIELSSRNSEINLSINHNKNYEGSEINIKVTDYHNKINIYNNDEKIDTDINSTGIWSMYYMNKKWYAYKKSYNIDKMKAIYCDANELNSLKQDFQELLSQLKKVGLMNY